MVQREQNREIDRMKLRLITVFVLVFIILLCTACVGKEEQAEKTQIKSTVVSWSDNSITVKSDDGTNYTFNVDKEQLDQYKNKLSPGNTADIEFYGRLDDFVDVQNVKVENSHKSVGIEYSVGENIFLNDLRAKGGADVYCKMSR